AHLLASNRQRVLYGVPPRIGIRGVADEDEPLAFRRRASDRAERCANGQRSRGNGFQNRIHLTAPPQDGCPVSTLLFRSPQRDTSFRDDLPLYGTAPQRLFLTKTIMECRHHKKLNMKFLFHFRAARQGGSSPWLAG